MVTYAPPQEVKLYSNPALKKQTLLLVDDDRNGLNTLEALFENQYNTIACSDCRDALIAIEETDVDLILLDVNMPRINGHEFCALLKSNPATANIPVIFLTGNSSADTEIKGLQAGAVDCISKPARPDKLRLKIENHMRLASHRHNLAQQSFTDPLTGIANRKFTEAMLKREWFAASRSLQPLSLVLIDIDNFKDYNDSQGSRQGDECLQQIASTLNNALHRETDFFGRYDGDEFIVILPQTDTTGAINISEKLMEAIHHLALPYPGNSVAEHISVSMGLATYTPDIFAQNESVPEDLLNETYQFLDQAKKSGKNTSRY